MKDCGGFTMSCSIGDMDLDHVLCDFKANINFMPLSIFKTLGIGEAQPKKTMLQFADRFIARLERKIEYMLVKVDKFIFPTDLVILDYEADQEVPIILRWPFLSTGPILITKKS